MTPFAARHSRCGPPPGPDLTHPTSRNHSSVEFSPQDQPPPLELLGLLFARLSSVPPDADAAAIVLLAPLPAGEAPWLPLTRLNGPPPSDAAGEDCGGGVGGRRDWALDPELQAALVAAEANKAHMRNRAWAEVVAGLPAGRGGDGPEGATDATGAMDAMARRDHDAAPMLKLAAPLALETSLYHEPALAADGADDGLPAVDSDEAATAKPAVGSDGGERAGRPDRSSGVGWGEGARSFDPAHPSVAWADPAAMWRAETVVMAAEGGAGVWVTADELREACRRAPLAVTAGPGEDPTGAGRCGARAGRDEAWQATLSPLLSPPTTPLSRPPPPPSPSPLPPLPPHPLFPLRLPLAESLHSAPSPLSP
jgi:hypothetical protein